MKNSRRPGSLYARLTKSGKFSAFGSKHPSSMRITGSGVVEVDARDLLESDKVKKDFESATRIVAKGS